MTVRELSPLNTWRARGSRSPILKHGRIRCGRDVVGAIHGIGSKINRFDGNGGVDFLQRYAKARRSQNPGFGSENPEATSVIGDEACDGCKVLHGLERVVRPKV